jgi:hypothetical protein
VSNGRDTPKTVEVRDRSNNLSHELAPDPFAPSGPRRGREATAPSLQSATPRNRKDQSEEDPMHYIADDLDTDAWVKAGFARLERYLALWRLFTELHPSDAP